MHSDYTVSFSVDRSKEEAFRAISDVRNWWWGAIEGDAHLLGGEFTYRYGDLHYSKQRVVELTAPRRVVWEVSEAELSFVENRGEWAGTRIVFEIDEEPGGGATVRMTHHGLQNNCECWDACSSGWNSFVKGSLRDFILTGRNQPDPFANG
jgi:hypothetical protein